MRKNKTAYNVVKDSCRTELRYKSVLCLWARQGKWSKCDALPLLRSLPFTLANSILSETEKWVSFCTWKCSGTIYYQMLFSCRVYIMCILRTKRNLLHRSVVEDVCNNATLCNTGDSMLGDDGFLCLFKCFGIIVFLCHACSMTTSNELFLSLIFVVAEVQRLLLLVATNPNYRVELPNIRRTLSL